MTVGDRRMHPLGPFVDDRVAEQVLGEVARRVQSDFPNGMAMGTLPALVFGEVHAVH